MYTVYTAVDGDPQDRRDRAGGIVDAARRFASDDPTRLDAAADPNFSLWHSAVFDNAGTKVVFTDEWGGGTEPMCRASSMMEIGDNTTLTITPDRKFEHGAYFTIPSAQTAQESCVSHNGGLVPVPGRDMVVAAKNFMWRRTNFETFDRADGRRTCGRSCGRSCSFTALDALDRGGDHSPPLGPPAGDPLSFPRCPCATTASGSRPLLRFR